MTRLLAAALAAAALAAPGGTAFTDVTPGSGIPLQKHAEGVCMSDMDGDGLPELYLPNVKGPDRLFRNTGKLKFTDTTNDSGITVTGGIGAVVGDLDSDGRKDVYVVRGAYPYGLNVLYLAVGGGVFNDCSEAAGVQSKKNGITAVLGDYDTDGDPDVFVANWGPDTLYRNDSGPGRPAFNDVSLEAGVGADGRSWAAVFSDFNGDALPDLFVARGGQGTADTSRLYINEGGGVFEDKTASFGLGGVSAIGVVSSDLDCDGDMDIFVTCFEGKGALFINDGTGRFTDATEGSGIDSARSVGAAAGDVDGDLLPDIVVAGFAGPVRLYINKGGGKFSRVTEGSGLGPHKKNEGLALGDLDGDGDLDLYVASYDGHNALYRNNQDPKRFIRVRPVRGAGAATGAKVTLYRPGERGKPGRLLASGECQAGSGFCSQSPEEALFVLPDDGPYDLTVVFPGGAAVEKNGAGPGEYEIKHPTIGEP